MSQLNTAHYI